LFGNRALAGSLNNFAGHQLFDRIYWLVEPPAVLWDCVLAGRPPADCAAQKSLTLVQPQNGPATRRIGELMGGWAAKSGYEPDKFVDDFFADPEDTSRLDKRWLINTEVIDRLGYVKGDALVLRGFWETVRAHPLAYAYSVAAVAAWYFGISLDRLVYRIWSAPYSGPIVFANWVRDPFESLPGDSGRVAQYTLPKELFEIYERRRAQPMGWLALRIHEAEQEMRAAMRNILGLVLLVSWPALILARARMLALYFLGSLALMIGIYSATVDYDPRYEHAILPVMIMTTALALDALIRRLAR